MNGARNESFHAFIVFAPDIFRSLSTLIRIGGKFSSFSLLLISHLVHNHFVSGSLESLLQIVNKIYVYTY